MACLDHLLSDVHEERTLREDAAESVEVLIVGVVVRIAERVPLIDVRHHVVEPVRVGEPDLRSALAVADRDELVGEPVIFKIILDAHVQVASHVQKMYRSVPLVVREQVEHEQLRFGNVVLLRRHRKHDILRNLRLILFVEDSVFYDIFLVHRNHELARADVIHHLARRERNLRRRMAEDAHHVGKENGAVAGVVDVDEIVGAVEILARADAQIERGGLVAGPLHLVYVPVGAEQRGVHDAHVRTALLDLLGIPEREGVVVAVGYQDAVLPAGIEIVVGHLDGRAAVASVVVVPVLGPHQGGHAEADKRHGGGDSGSGGLRREFLLGEQFLNPRI